MMGVLRRMGGQLRICDSAQQNEPCCQYPNGQSLSHSLHQFLSYRSNAAFTGSCFWIRATTSLIICSVSNPPLIYSRMIPC